MYRHIFNMHTPDFDNFRCRPCRFHTIGIDTFILCTTAGTLIEIGNATVNITNGNKTSKIITLIV